MLAPDALVCPNCHRFTHAKELEELATRARQLVALNQLRAAREHWQAALQLLPEDSPQTRTVLREIEKLDERLSPKQSNWAKRAGPLGVVVAFLLKFKTAALLLLTKGKFLFSILAFVGVYWAVFGWWFAVGLTVSVLFHEMGHYVAVRSFGFKADLPMFVPGFGAFVKWNGTNVDVGTRAYISLAGPLFGFLSGLIAYGIYLGTGQPLWLALAQFVGWLNLLNLIPIFIFDGGTAMNALGQQARVAVLLVSVVLFFVLLKESLFLFVAAGAGYRVWKRDLPSEPKQEIAYAFLALIMANGLLSWFAKIQLTGMFPHRLAM